MQAYQITVVTLISLTSCFPVVCCMHAIAQVNVHTEFSSQLWAHEMDLLICLHRPWLDLCCNCCISSSFRIPGNMCGQLDLLYLNLDSNSSNSYNSFISSHCIHFSYFTKVLINTMFGVGMVFLCMTVPMYIHLLGLENIFNFLIYNAGLNFMNVFTQSIIFLSYYEKSTVF